MKGGDSLSIEDSKESQTITTDDRSFTWTGKDAYTITDIKIEPMDYQDGYQAAEDDIKKYIEELGKLLCVLMDFIPGKSISLVWKVDEECSLKITFEKV